MLSRRLYTVPLLLLIGMLAGCASLERHSIASSWNAWQRGDTSASLDALREEVERYRLANDVSARAIAAARMGAVADLEETPIPFGAGPKRVPGLGGPAQSLQRELQTDLRSQEATSALRALHTIGTLKVRPLALSVMALIYRGQTYPDTGPLLAGATNALRSMVVLTMALETLRALASTRL